MSLPDDDPRPLARHSTAREEARWRLKLARKWAYRLSMTVYLPISHEHLEEELLRLVDTLSEAASSEPFGTEAAAEAGARLVDLHATGRSSLQCTMEILGKGLLARRPPRQPERIERVLALLSALASGYSERLRMSVFDQQESVNGALIDTLQEAGRNLRASEAQFDELFARSASGVAITDLDGNLARTNGSFQKILDRGAEDLSGLTVFDLVAPDEAESLRDVWRDLLRSRPRQASHTQQWRRFTRGDGETVLAKLSVALLRDGADQPDRYVAVIEDDTELTLLQRRLSHQSLHDMLTGLPNRQFFTSRLEQMLRQADPAAGVTLYHLDLDGFSLIADGLGRAAGDHLLCVVAERLEQVVRAERAMVARFGGDEFAIVIENGPETRDMLGTVHAINEVLAEPVYLAEYGVAIPASIGVVDRPPPDIAPDELLRAADLTLRRARRKGRGQWELFDASEDARDRTRFGLAAQMPGAWENGEISVAYRPVFGTAEGRTVGVEAVLRWAHDGIGVLDHDRCVALADETGLTVPLGAWLLRSACARIAGYGQLPLSVVLTPNQAGDPDLVGTVLRALEQADMLAHRLRLVFPLPELVAGHGEVLDNVRVLTDLGVCVVLGDFAGGLADLAGLEDVPVCAVRFSQRLVRQLSRPAGRFAIREELAGLVRLMHAADVRVVVDGIETDEQARWWREIGADRALGGYFAPGEPATDLDSLLR
ncbi:putative bifunctional diguanylate cyclase/phosphodiesterase [Amycolatopsis cihanbeyliensis]|uniref:PAS domain S-box-containing protein/diguanylate cyclase (GGDEF)-like protein n=1 Tax=Amycolatopsis cihanbeyliensis TaxID=1128664 RepID=A0A542DR64_AMYCI|nr:EAL domain-containing protein [Amycolatopsis cihanbeyliensis]TQJ05570.1 PAS domain S-box-containing protein/diguanylate cyclase (GGDEF)-like protein [Amycolatopsis cihanbeyliensis]